MRSVKTSPFLHLHSLVLAISNTVTAWRFAFTFSSFFLRLYTICFFFWSTERLAELWQQGPSYFTCTWNTTLQISELACEVLKVSFAITANYLAYVLQTSARTILGYRCTLNWINVTQPLQRYTATQNRLVTSWKSLREQYEYSNAWYLWLQRH